MHFEVYEREIGGWRWRLIAADGKTVAKSAENYKRKNECARAISEVCAGVQHAAATEIRFVEYQWTCPACEWKGRRADAITSGPEAPYCPECGVSM